MTKKNVKKRNWAFILYPESAPENWRQILSETGLQCAVSPLHNLDVNEETGEIKKEHYHIILCFNGPTSYNVVKNITDSLNSPTPQPLQQIKGYYRYLTHMDNPEKYQYNSNDITFINGFSPIDFIDLSKSEILKIQIDLIRLINQFDIIEYSTFIDTILDKNMIDGYEVASSNTYFFDRYICSRRNQKKEEEK